MSPQDDLAGTLPAAWSQRWKQSPSEPFLLDDGRWITTAQLDEESALLAGRWSAASMEPGQRVLFACAPSAQLVIAHVAALRMGLVVVPVNPALSHMEMSNILSDSRPGAVVVDNPAQAEWIRATWPEIIVTGPTVDLPPGPPPPLDECQPADLAMLCYTSGTTGKPKGALLSHANLYFGADSLRQAWHWTDQDRLVLALPLFHIHGLGIGLHGTLLAGASAVLLRRFDPAQVVDVAIEHRASLFFGVPTMYSRLVDTPHGAALSRLRLCVSGSAALAADLHHEISTVCGQQVLERYGLTETMINASNPYVGERRPGTVGFALPGIELRLGSYPGSDRSQPGEIQVRGPNVCGGYWGRSGQSTDAISPSGWFKTGDIGQFDPDGYLRIVGRIKELIITGGYNVYPREVEDALSSHPDVADVAVIGTPSKEWGEIVIAVVVPVGVGDDKALLAHVADRLAPYKRPRLVRFVERIPRNAMGKVVRADLAED